MAVSQLDQIPGDSKLYIGGIFTVQLRKGTLKEANITHVVSALRQPPLLETLPNAKRRIVEVDDIEDDNILEHFPACNAFIQDGLDGGGGVLVHCAMGKSRSAALIIAYLLSTRPDLKPQTALNLIRQSRPNAEPNEGFMQQLWLYHSMGCPPTTNLLDSNPGYQRWLYQRTISASNAVGQAPEISNLHFSDEDENKPSPPDPSSHPNPTQPPHPNNNTTTHPHPNPPQTLYRCRRCRTPLANSTYILPHNPQNKPQPHLPPCAHIHTSPLSWMRPELETGKIEGRFECPGKKCSQSVGRYAWQGMKCSCGVWVVPGMTLSRGRVDEVVLRERGGGGGDGDGKAEERDINSRSSENL